MVSEKRQLRGGVLHGGGTTFGSGVAHSLALTFPNKPAHLLLALLYALAALLMLSAPAYGATWYVDKDATGANNGTAWGDAFTTIQPAIDAAFADGGGEVWVAEGVYNEARTSVNADGSDLDTGSIVMKSGVELYGGFVGTETARAQRDWEINVTTIDGSTLRGGLAAYHAIVRTNNATLDGFTVTGGNASGNTPADRGGGMYNFSSSPTVTDCTFTGIGASRALKLKEGKS